MGDGLDSVTDANCKFRQVTNAYVAALALLPTIGPPNPMLTGIALARRLGDHLAIPQPYVAPAGLDVLSNGFDMSNWRMSAVQNQPGKPGFFRIINATLETVAGNELGLLWCTKPTPANFILSSSGCAGRRTQIPECSFAFPTRKPKITTIPRMSESTSVSRCRLMSLASRTGAAFTKPAQFIAKITVNTTKS